MKIIETLDGDLINITNFQSIIYQERERDYAEPHHVQIRANGDVWDFDFASREEATDFIHLIYELLLNDNAYVTTVRKNFRVI